METSTVTLEELIECPICSETYTLPKMLPCQHTFCHVCLLSATVREDQRKVTCPRCQTEHEIPREDGVFLFADNLIVEQLLRLVGSLSIARKEALCSDCKESPRAVASCKHCHTQICATCMVKHIELSKELRSSSEDLEDDLTSEESKRRLKEKRPKLAEYTTDLKKEVVRMKEVLDGAIQQLVLRRSLLADYLEVVVRIHEDMLRLCDDGSDTRDLFVCELLEKLPECETVDALQESKDLMADFRTATRLIREGDDQFKFSADRNTMANLETFGHVKCGQAVVDIKCRGYGSGKVTRTLRSRKEGVMNVAEETGSAEIVDISVGNQLQADNAIANIPTSEPDMSNISPPSHGLIIEKVYESGTVYDPAILDISDNDLRARFMQGVANVASVCLEIGYPTIASVPHSIANGFKNLLAVAAETEYTFKEAERTKAYLMDLSAFASAAPVAAAASSGGRAAAKVEEKEEESEESDDDIGFGLFH